MNNNQAKRPHPKYTLGIKQDAAKSVNQKGYTHQQAANNLSVFLRFKVITKAQPYRQKNSTNCCSRIGLMYN
jgi:hypothetical protein